MAEGKSQEGEAPPEPSVTPAPAFARALLPVHVQRVCLDYARNQPITHAQTRGGERAAETRMPHLATPGQR